MESKIYVDPKGDAAVAYGNIQSPQQVAILSPLQESKEPIDGECIYTGASECQCWDNKICVRTGQLKNRNMADKMIISDQNEPSIIQESKEDEQEELWNELHEDFRILLDASNGHSGGADSLIEYLKTNFKLTPNQ